MNEPSLAVQNHTLAERLFAVCVQSLPLQLVVTQTYTGNIV